jgi:hypothetical protein
MDSSNHLEIFPKLFLGQLEQTILVDEFYLLPAATILTANCTLRNSSRLPTEN